MTLDTLKDGLAQCSPVIKDFLKTILLKKVEVDITSSDLADSGAVSKSLKGTPVLVKTADGNLGVDLVIGFDESWIAQLATAMLEIEETKLNEVTRDLMKEFTSQLIGAVQTTLKEKFDILFDAEPVEILKPAGLSAALKKEQYFVASVQVTGKFEIEGDEKPQLGFVVVFSIPDGVSYEAGAADSEGAGEDPSVKKMGPKTESKSNGAPARNGNEPLTAQKVEFDDLSSVAGENSDVEVRNLELLREVKIQVSVELGRRELPLGEVLHLVRGSVIELDKLAGEPVSVYANGRTIAEGEVVVIDEHFGVRITNLISAKERIEVLQ